MDNSEYRRTIEELGVRYLLEPNLRDLYVEGPGDVALFSWYFVARGLRGRAYEICTVEVPDDLVRIPGNRGRVIALAEVLENSLSNNNDAVRCVIDRDLDAIFDVIAESRILWLTDYASMDCYVWTEKVIRKLFEIVFRRKISVNLMQDMGKVLREVFMIRAARHVTAPNLPWVTFTRCCVINNGQIKFNQEDYVYRLFNSGGRLNLLDEAREWTRHNAAKFTGDDRLYIHGHDLMELLGWIARQLGVPHGFCKKKELHRSTVGCVEITDLMEHSLFCRLEAWATV